MCKALFPTTRNAKCAGPFGTHLSPFSARGARSTRVSEALENCSIKRVVQYIPLRVPLHRQRKQLIAVDSHGFDKPIRRTRFHDQTVRESVDALPVQRIDPPGTPAGEGGYQSTGFGNDFVSRTVTDIERR